MLRQHACLAALLCVISSTATHAGKPSGHVAVGDPETYGFSESGLSKLRQEFNQAIEDGEIAGMVGLIARNGRLVFHEALGMKDRESGEPMPTDAIFYIASLTKIIVSAGAMILCDEKKLGLDNPVADYLPNLRHLTVLEQDGEDWKEVPPHRPMTVRHLLTHTAGLTYGWSMQDKVDQLFHEQGIRAGNATIADMVSKLDRIPLKYHPGEVWEYSIASDVLGRVIEVASGQPLDEFLRMRIFNPLDMNGTGFGAVKENAGRVAIRYKLDDNGKAVRSTPYRSWTATQTGNTTYFSGGGGLSSTAPDYYAFMQMLLSGGEYNGVRILSRKSVKAMTANQIEGVEISSRMPWVGNHGFGLGLSMYDAPDQKGVCYGWGGATGTSAWLNIEKDMIGVFMIHIGTGKFSRRFHALTHAAFSD